jgi:hypothetical protein
MRSRANGFWGRRAYLPLAVPILAFGEPLPPPVKLPGKPWSDGMSEGWIDENGQLFIIHASRLSSSGAPDRSEESDIRRKAFYVRQEPYCGFSWWEGYVLRYESEAAREAGEDFKEILPLPSRLFDTIVARNDWESRYTETDMSPRMAKDTFDEALAKTSYWCKTVYFTYPGAGAYPEQGFIIVTFSVKWFIRLRKRQFCLALKHLFDVARRDGVRLHLHH